MAEEKDYIVLDKDEYRYLKDMADRYDPFWFCTYGGCEGISPSCKETCPMSIFVKERTEIAEKIDDFLCKNDLLGGWGIQAYRQFIKEQFDVEIKVD